MLYSKGHNLLRETDLPPSYSFEEEELVLLLELSYDAVLFFRHPQAQILPLGQINASKLTFYREAVAFWGWRRLKKMSKWWKENYFFSADDFETFLEIGHLKKVTYKNHLLGGIIGDSVWFCVRTRLIYSNEQLRAFVDSLSKRVGCSLEISELSVKNLSTYFSLE